MENNEIENNLIENNVGENNQPETTEAANLQQRTRTIQEVQNDFAQNLGFESFAIWDLLSENQGEILKQKIKELIPDQKKGQPRIEQMRETLFNSVWSQRKYTNRQSLSAILYVCVSDETDFNVVKESNKNFTCHPIFRTRKCVKNDDSSNCCMIFIDENGRVYQDWQSFVNENELPRGLMVAPRHGYYTFNQNHNVQLDVYLTPASSVTSQVLNVADTTSAVGGFMAAAVPIAALLTIPVSAPLMAVSAAVGLTAAGYSAVRSGTTLVDRSRHEQSVGLGDRQARNSWLGFIGGAVGLGAMGATTAMTAAVARGRDISVVTRGVVNGMNISSIVLSGSGVANGAVDMILKYQGDEEISLLDVVQLSASLVLFTHSVTNFRLASTIVNETRNSTIQSYRSNLSNRQRRMFDKMSKETIRIKGANQGKIDIIRSVNDIPDKQYLNDLFKINKNLNEKQIRPSFSGKGDGVVLNNDVKVDTKVLRNSVQHKIGADVLGQVKNSIPPTYTESSGIMPATSTAQIKTAQLLFDGKRPIDDFAIINPRNLSPGVQSFLQATIVFSNGMKLYLSKLGNMFFEHIQNAQSFEDIMNVIVKLPELLCRFILNLAREFIEQKLENIEKVLKTFISTESVLYRIMLEVKKNYSQFIFEQTEDKAEQLTQILKDYFMSLNPNNNKNPNLCDKCRGIYAIVPL